MVATSRTRRMKVRLTPENVTRIDRVSCPILETGEAPAAIANGVFDATGFRIRRGSFSPQRIKSLIERGQTA